MMGGGTGTGFSTKQQPQTVPAVSGLVKKTIVFPKAKYHPTLKVIAYEENAGSTALKMWRYLENECIKLDNPNEGVMGLNSQVKGLYHFPQLQIFLMETFGGYKKI
jgi:hypothetical protein